MFPLIVVDPLVLLSYNPPIGDCFGQVRLHHHQLVDCLPLATLILSSIANDDLRGVLIGHHNCWLRESWSESVRIVRFKRFLHHASMILATIFECWACPRLFFRREFLVLIGVRMFPAGLFKWESYCHCSTLFHNNVGAGLNSCINEERCWFLQFLLQESLFIVQLSIVIRSRRVRSIENTSRLRSWSISHSRVWSFDVQGSWLRSRTGISGRLNVRVLIFHFLILNFNFVWSRYIWIIAYYS
jgi:hypothetical protein